MSVIRANNQIFLYSILITLFSVTVQILALLYFKQYSTYFLIAFFLISISALLILYIKNPVIILLSLTLIPLVYLNNTFHYSLNNEIIMSLPVFILTGSLIFGKFLKGNIYSFKLTYIQLPIYLYLLYSVITAVIGIISGHHKYYVFYELFQIFYFGYTFVIYHFLKNDSSFKNIFNVLLIVALAISFQYLYINILAGDRFVTYQSNYFPLVIGVVFAFILFKVGNRFILSIILTILVAGAFITLTRTLWITIGISMIAVLFFYLKINKRKYLKLLILPTFLILAFSIYILANKSQNINSTPQTASDVEARTESISNPLSDLSLLMRVEIGYYALQRFIESPIFGQGLGDYVNYKITLDVPDNVYYTDSTYFYILWKQGIIGFLLFGWVFFRLIKVLITLTKCDKDKYLKAFVTGLSGSLVGFILLNLLSPLFIKYNAIIILSVIFAFIDSQNQSQG